MTRAFATGIKIEINLCRWGPSANERGGWQRGRGASGQGGSGGACVPQDRLWTLSCIRRAGVVRRDDRSNSRLATVAVWPWVTDNYGRLFALIVLLNSLTFMLAFKNPVQLCSSWRGSFLFRIQSKIATYREIIDWVSSLIKTQIWLLIWLPIGWNKTVCCISWITVPRTRFLSYSTLLEGT